MAGHTHFDESTEEYLEAIYRLEREGPGVTTSGLASELGVAPASVSGMLKKLAGDGYINHQSRGEAKLTTKGLEVAVRVLRRHRLAECLLVNVLGMPWDAVHSEACRLEHAISAEVEAHMIVVLGDPKMCPHGHPIPPADLSPPVYIGMPLAQAAVGDAYVIHGVTDEISEVLRYLSEIGLVPGREVRVIEKAPFGGPITIVSGSTHHAISLELARMVTVLEHVDAGMRESATVTAPAAVVLAS